MPALAVSYRDEPKDQGTVEARLGGDHVRASSVLLSCADAPARYGVKSCLREVAIAIAIGTAIGTAIAPVSMLVNTPVDALGLEVEAGAQAVVQAVAQVPVVVQVLVRVVFASLAAVPDETLLALL